MSLSLEQYQQQFMQGMTGNNDATHLPEFVTPIKRLPVYQDHYREVLLKCLQDCFVCTKELLGERIFNDFALEYIQQYPSVSEDLVGYGADFSIFLHMKISLTNVNYPPRFICDVAHYDFLRQGCYYAANHQAFPLELFIGLNDEQQLASQIMKQAGLLLQKSKFNLLDISGQAVLEYPSYHFYMHYRQEGKVKITTVDEATFNLLKTLQQAQPISQLNEAQIEMLPTFINNGWLMMNRGSHEISG